MTQKIVASPAAVITAASGASFFNLFAQAVAVRRQRKALCRLDDHLLQDLGVTRAEVEAEAARSFWDFPKQ